jgi:hypothetical protein
MAAPVEVTIGKVAPTAVYRASRIALFGIPFAVADCLVGTGYTNVGVGFVATPTFGPWRPALIYGYTYQGHVYSLPEPVIMLVDRATATPANEAGYGQGYMRWEADKLDRTAQLMLTNDTFEELILRKNIGETRQPMSYHAAMAISHRGGKLMD